MLENARTLGIESENGVGFYLGGYAVSIINNCRATGAFEGQSFKQELDDALLEAEKWAFPRLDLTLTTKALQHLVKTSGLSFKDAMASMKAAGPAFGVRSLLIATAPTLLDALYSTMNMASLTTNVYANVLTETAEKVFITLYFNTPVAREIRHYLLGLSGDGSFYMAQRQNLGLAPTTTTHLYSSAHPLSSALSPSVLNQLPIQIAISRETLKGVMPTANATEYALIQTLFEPYFNESVRPTVFKRQLLTQLAHRRRAQQSMSLVDLAKENNLSQTSFKRRLSEQGSSFNEIKTAFLAAEASLLLGAGGASVPSDDLETVSNQLGYGSLSAFSRAFKQWYGISPLKFRQLSSAAKP